MTKLEKALNDWAIAKIRAAKALEEWDKASNVEGKAEQKVVAIMTKRNDRKARRL